MSAGPRRRPALPRALGIGIGIVLVLGGAALYRAMTSPSSAPAPTNPIAGSRNAPALRTYTVRGQIIQLPDPAKPSATLQIKHEAIDDFARRDGTLGMDSMVMPFPVAPGISLDGLAVGDIVEFDFSLDWSAAPTYQVTRLAKLPRDTPLVFIEATPPPR